MNRAILKDKAKEQLGRNIFGNIWLTALLVCLIVSAVCGIISAIPVAGGIVTLIITGPLTYSLAYMFLKQARDGQKMDFADILAGFKDDFAQNFILSLLMGIFVILWSLLFIIPGIVKTYSYSMAFYIKADHPEYNWKQCLDGSKALTNGHKGELFVLDLSFIGWMIVGALCFGIGTLWVMPYISATKAQFYNELVSGTQNGDAQDFSQPDEPTYQE